MTGHRKNHRFNRTQNLPLLQIRIIIIYIESLQLLFRDDDMAAVDADLNELSHHLRFLLFETGIGLSQAAIEHFISLAHGDCLKRLQRAALNEQLITKPLAASQIQVFISDLQSQMKKNHPASLFYQWHLLRFELNESIANEALALAYRQGWHAEIEQQAKGHPTLWSWLNAAFNPEDALTFLEQWGCIGHPYHPNFRCKSGLSRREVMQYSPEFNARISLHWAALKRDRAHTTESTTAYQHLLASHFPWAYQKWSEQLRFKHLNPDAYFPVPVHPWQWRNQITTLFAQLIDDKDLELIPHLQHCKPSMSFRTMIPQGSGSCHLKLATAIHTTSSLRTVSPASVDNGPALSLWLTTLFAQHDHYQQSLFLAGDLAGLNVMHPNIPLHQRNQLALLVRANPLQWCSDNQRIVPLAALFAQSPLSKKSLLAEIIDASLLPADHYFATYCRCVLAGQIDLLLRYGIALESHQQNTLVNFSNHLPVSLVIRDLGNIKISTHAFYEDLPKPVLHPSSTITTDKLEAVCNQFIHANLQCNLAYWIHHIHYHYGIPQQTLWQTVYLCVKSLLNNLAPTVNPAVHAWFQEQLLARDWAYKSLLSMRLNPVKDRDVFTPVSNLLSPFHK